MRSGPTELWSRSSLCFLVITREMNESDEELLVCVFCPSPCWCSSYSQMRSLPVGFFDGSWRSNNCFIGLSNRWKLHGTQSETRVVSMTTTTTRTATRTTTKKTNQDEGTTWNVNSKGLRLRIKKKRRRRRVIGGRHSNGRWIAIVDRRRRFCRRRRVGDRPPTAATPASAAAPSAAPPPLPTSDRAASRGRRRGWPTPASRPPCPTPSGRSRPLSRKKIIKMIRI